MAKGPIVTDEIEALIASVYQQHPKWTAKMVCNEVNSLLRKKDQNLPSNWPGLSIVQKILAIVRKNSNKKPADEQDSLWSMSTLDQYPISPQALPIIITVWKHRKFLLTIREAKWVARFSSVTEEIIKLSNMAMIYALTEKISHLINRRFNSARLDRWIFTDQSICASVAEWALVMSTTIASGDTEHHMMDSSIKKPTKTYASRQQRGAINERINKVKKQK